MSAAGAAMRPDTASAASRRTARISAPVAGSAHAAGPARPSPPVRSRIQLRIPLVGIALHTKKRTRLPGSTRSASGAQTCRATYQRLSERTPHPPTPFPPLRGGRGHHADLHRSGSDLADGQLPRTAPYYGVGGLPVESARVLPAPLSCRARQGGLLVLGRPFHALDWRRRPAAARSQLPGAGGAGGMRARRGGAAGGSRAMQARAARALRPPRLADAAGRCQRPAAVPPPRRDRRGPPRRPLLCLPGGRHPAAAVGQHFDRAAGAHAVARARGRAARLAGGGVGGVGGGIGRAALLVRGPRHSRISRPFQLSSRPRRWSRAPAASTPASSRASSG